MTPTAQEIIERVKARYAVCRSYEDTGRVAVRVAADTIEDRFRTAFRRDAGFRFELSKSGHGPHAERVRGIGWSVARGGHWWTLPARRSLGRDYDLPRARSEIALLNEFGTVDLPPIALAAGPLLFPDLGPMPPVISTLVRVKPVVLRAKDCFVLRGPQDSTDVHLWIDASSWLLRQFRGAVDIYGIPGVCNVEWEPRLDTDIDPSVFEFTPPG